MATFFVVSDVHGFYDIMMDALNEAGFDLNNKNHIFVSLGDLLDRGEQPQQCLEFVNSLPKSRKILIKGNHESLIEECIDRKEFLAHDYHNGTVLTMDLLAQSPENIIDQMASNILWLNYINSCIDYYENSKYVFVHGWIPCKRIIHSVDLFNDYHYMYKFDSRWRTGDWEFARWINGMDCWSKGIRIPDKTILCGHWHSSWGNCILHNDGPEFPQNNEEDYGKWNYHEFKDDGIICLDACTVLSQHINCIKLYKQKFDLEKEE